MKDLHNENVLISVRFCGPIPAVTDNWWDVLELYRNTIKAAMAPGSDVDKYSVDWYPSTKEITQREAAKWSVYMRLLVMHVAYAKALARAFGGVLGGLWEVWRGPGEAKGGFLFKSLVEMFVFHCFLQKIPIYLVQT